MKGFKILGYVINILLYYGVLTCYFILIGIWVFYPEEFYKLKVHDLIMLVAVLIIGLETKGETL